MNRNSFVVESLKAPAAGGQRSVWAMSLAMIGAAFGAPMSRAKDPVR